MNELERREVTILNKYPQGKLKMRIQTSGPNPREFGLFDEKDVLVATSLSDHALADWAFKNGATRITYDYDLREGDDGR